jgi:diguanylate cyclase (GGDEF)-like protein
MLPKCSLSRHNQEGAPLIKKAERLGPRTDDPHDAARPVRALVVESDSRAALLILEMLRATWSAGLVAAHVERLVDATQELLEHTPDALLLGLPLTDGDHIAATQHLRTAAPEVPIIVLFDHPDEDASLAAIEAGAQDCLVKDQLDPGLLRRALRYAIGRKRTEIHLTHQALHDPLTGLPNRTLFLDRLGVALDRSRRSGGAVAVLFLDVDNFKQINDSLGHAAGDAVLAELAERMRTMLRPMDTVARFGGDEFTFLFEGLASEREAVAIAERISGATSRPLRVDGQETSAAVTVSIGIAMVDDPAVPADTVIREADAAMYRAKEHGRSRFELFDQASRRRTMERLE